MQRDRDYSGLSEWELVRRFRSGDPAAVRTVTAMNNQRLFRAAWSILKNRDEAEDVVQTSYLRAFAASASFRGESTISTWLTRIAINEALGRRRSAIRQAAAMGDGSVIVLDEYRNRLMRGSSQPHPDEAIAREEIRQLLEAAIARLPHKLRVAFVLREVEHMEVAEVADLLGIPAATVKTRCLRARRQLRRDLTPEVQATVSGTFPFAGSCCAGLTQRVLDLIGSC